MMIDQNKHCINFTLHVIKNVVQDDEILCFYQFLNIVCLLDVFDISKKNTCKGCKYVFGLHYIQCYS